MDMAFYCSAGLDKEGFKVKYMSDFKGEQLSIISKFFEFVLQIALTK